MGVYYVDLRLPTVGFPTVGFPTVGFRCLMSDTVLLSFLVEKQNKIESADIDGDIYFVAACDD
jgi:hypothetical protein